MARDVEEMAPASGRILKEDNTVVNAADLLEDIKNLLTQIELNTRPS